MSFSCSAAWHKWTWTGLGKRPSTVYYFCQACVWGVLSAGKCFSYKWHHSDQFACSCPWALTHRQIFSPFLSPLFRRRNTQTWSYREEPTTLVSIYAFAVWRLDVPVRRCWRNWKQTLSTSLNSVIMEDTAVFVVVLKLGIVLSKLRKPEPPAGGPKQILSVDLRNCLLNCPKQTAEEKTDL